MRSCIIFLRYLLSIIFFLPLVKYNHDCPRHLNYHTSRLRYRFNNKLIEKKSQLTLNRLVISLTYFMRSLTIKHPQWTPSNKSVNSNGKNINIQRPNRRGTVRAEAKSPYGGDGQRKRKKERILERNEMFPE